MFARAAVPPSRNDFFNISESFRASNFKIYHNVVLDSLYILTGNDATVYFRAAANRTKVSISGRDFSLFPIL